MGACRNLEVARSRGRGRPRMTWRARLDGDMEDTGLRPRMTWRARLDGDMKDMGLRPEMAMDREKWSVASWGERLTRISAETTDVKRVVV